MRLVRSIALYVFFLVLLAGALAGWVLTQRKGAAPPPKPPPPAEVTVALPVEREMTEFLVFPGRTAAVENVEVRARVGGYLLRTCFKDGSDINKGDLLFEIDPAPYQASLAQAEGTRVASEAKVKTQELELARFKALAAKGGISGEQVDQTVGAVAEGVATRQSLEAGVARAKLDLEYTKVLAPITGLIGRQRVTPGNVVTANETVLTTIVSVDPIYAYFEVDESTVLRARKMLRERKITDYRYAQLPVALGLAGEAGFPHLGAIDFAENQLDSGTGTLTVRGVFANKDRAISAGMFVRVRFPLGGPHPALLVPDRALGVDQRGEFIKVVGSGDVVEDRLVTTGDVESGMVVIDSGVKAGERVIVRGLQRARSGAKVVVKAEEPAAAAVATRAEPGTGAGMEGGKKAR